jgi:endonuclease/exonuclease/phosphatase family metal-dependent hydrolase
MFAPRRPTLSPARRGRPLALEALEPREVPATIRIVTYNIEADINGVTTPRPGLYQVLEGIGEEQVQGHVQPLDILLLQETTSNTTTVDPIVSNLNSFYGSLATYARSPYQATQNGSNSSGNGPNALVYNTLTLNLLASVGVGTPQGSTNGEYRQVVRYEFQPVGATGSTGIFYVYTEHAKAGTTSSDFTARNQEAQIVRNDEATLPADARVLYTGDLNTTSSGDASYQTLTAATSPGGAAQGQGFDPINRPGNWDTNSAFKDIMSESATDLRYRDDHELATQNVLNNTAGGLGYISGSYHTFGVNGSTPEGGSVNNGSNTALNSDLVQDGPTFISAATLYADLTTASDHLPVVADYTISTTVPTTTTLTAAGPNPSETGVGVSFTATVAGGAVVSGETVTIRDASNGNAVVATPTLTNGTATVTVSGLGTGSHNLFAAYAGDATHAASQSGAVAQQVLPTFQVTGLVPTATGFRVTFDAPLDTGTPAMYGAAPANVSLLSGSSPVAGSLAIDPTGMAATFVATGTFVGGAPVAGVLSPGPYTVVLGGAAGGLRDSVGNALDGDGNGTPGDDYTGGFTVAASALPVVSAPYFARGYSQPVNLPGNSTNGIPLGITVPAGGAVVTSVVFDFAYDPTLLTVTGGSVVAGGFTGTVTVVSPGLVHVALGGGSLAAGTTTTVADLTAVVPGTALFKNKEVLDIRNISLNGGTNNGLDGSAVHVAAFVGDASFAHHYSAQDAFLINQFAVGGPSAQSADNYRVLDPKIIGDVDSNGTVNGQDAFNTNVQAVGNPTTPANLFPALPTGTSPGTGGPDPWLYLDPVITARVGDTVTVHLNINVTDPKGFTFESDDLAIRFDPARVVVSNVRAGGLLGSVATAANIDNAGGRLLVGQFWAAAGVPFLPRGTVGAILDFDITIRPGAGAVSVLKLARDIGPCITELNGGAATLSPAPDNSRYNPATDGVVEALGRRTGAVDRFGRDVAVVAAPPELGFVPWLAEVVGVRSPRFEIDHVGSPELAVLVPKPPSVPVRLPEEARSAGQIEDQWSVDVDVSPALEWGTRR